MFAISCSKNELSEQQKPLFNIENNMLVFDSETEFKEAIDLIIKAPDDFQAKLKNKAFIAFEDIYKDISEDEIEQLISSDNKFVTLVEDDGKNYVEATIDSPVLRKLLNEDGMIIIGDKAYKYTYDFVYSSPVDEIDKLFLTNYLTVDKQEIVRESTTLFDSELDTRVVASYCNDYFNDDDFRGVGKIYNNFYPGYSEVKVTTSNWRKRWYGWTRIRANSISQTGSVTTSYNVSGVGSWTQNPPKPADDSATNESEIHRIIAYWVFGPSVPIYLRIDDASTSHFVSDHGQNVSCNNNI